MARSAAQVEDRRGNRHQLRRSEAAAVRLRISPANGSAPGSEARLASP